MAVRKTPFTSADAMVAASIATVTVLLVAWILLSAEHVKRASAESIVEAVAAANKKRLEAGKPAITGPIDGGSPLVVDGDIEQQEWENLPYTFAGAEESRDACILALATRRTDGRWGTTKPPYNRWGVCATAKGDLEPFEGACALNCREPEPPPPAAAPPPPPPPAAPTPVARPVRPLRVDAPSLGLDKPVAKKGCSVTGCFGTTCCDEETDACLSCPGHACCPQMTGCNGICQNEDDCTIGCGCVKLPGSPTGNCRGK